MLCTPMLTTEIMKNRMPSIQKAGVFRNLFLLMPVATGLGSSLAVGAACRAESAPRGSRPLSEGFSRIRNRDTGMIMMAAVAPRIM